MGAMYVECSSKEMKGVDEVFELAVNTAVSQEVYNREQTASRTSKGSKASGGSGTSKSKKPRACKML